MRCEKSIFAKKPKVTASSIKHLTVIDDEKADALADAINNHVITCLDDLCDEDLQEIINKCYTYGILCATSRSKNTSSQVYQTRALLDIDRVIRDAKHE